MIKEVGAGGRFDIFLDSAYLTQLRVGLSKLCFHKFRYNFGDSIKPMSPINDGIETTEHFLLLCHAFEAERRNLLAGVFELLQPYGIPIFQMRY